MRYYEYKTYEDARHSEITVADVVYVDKYKVRGIVIRVDDDSIKRYLVAIKEHKIAEWFGQSDIIKVAPE